MDLELRKDCPVRHKNGNCLPCGGFCTAINDEICKALHNAYRHGYSDCSNDDLYEKPGLGGFRRY